MRLVLHTPNLAPSPTTARGAARRAWLIARALEIAGHDVVPAYWTSGGRGGGINQRRRAASGRLAARWVAAERAREPDQRIGAWLTYGAAAEAPDWIGPAVTDALDIPYIAVDPYLDAPAGTAAEGREALDAAVARADAVIAQSTAVAEAAASLLDDDARIERLPPFLELGAIRAAEKVRDQHCQAMAAALQLPPRGLTLLTVARLTGGDRVDGYRTLALTLSRLTMIDWTLLVVGDGPARAEVDAALRIVPPVRYRLCGERLGSALLPFYLAADLFLWPTPGPRHAQALLEAQAFGVPVVAAAGGGALDIVRDGVTGRLFAPGNAASFANALSFLMRNASFREGFGRAARDTVYAEHSIGPAADMLSGILDRTAARRRAG